MDVLLTIALTVAAVVLTLLAIWVLPTIVVAAFAATAGES